MSLAKMKIEDLDTESYLIKDGVLGKILDIKVEKEKNKFKVNISINWFERGYSTLTFPNECENIFKATQYDIDTFFKEPPFSLELIPSYCEYIAKTPDGQWWAFDLKPKLHNELTIKGWIREGDRPEKIDFKEAENDDWHKSLINLNRFQYKRK